MQDRGRVARSAPSCFGDLPTAPIEPRADPKTHVPWARSWSTCGRHRDMDAVAVRFGAVGLVAATLFLPLRTSTHYRG